MFTMFLLAMLSANAKDTVDSTLASVLEVGPCTSETLALAIPWGTAQSDGSVQLYDDAQTCDIFMKGPGRCAEEMVAGGYLLEPVPVPFEDEGTCGCVCPPRVQTPTPDLDEVEWEEADAQQCAEFLRVKLANLGGPIPQWFNIPDEELIEHISDSGIVPTFPLAPGSFIDPDEEEYGRCDPLADALGVPRAYFELVQSIPNDDGSVAGCKCTDCGLDAIDYQDLTSRAAIGLGNHASPYEVYTPTQFEDMANTGAGEHLKQCVDIDFQPFYDAGGVHGVARPNVSFNGMYDGLGHQCSNIELVFEADSPASGGVFGQIGLNGTLKDWSLVDATLTHLGGDGQMAPIWNSQGTVSEVVVDRLVVRAGGQVAGLISALNPGSSTTDVLVSDADLEATGVGSRTCGGVVGRSSGPATLQRVQVMDMAIDCGDVPVTVYRQSAGGVIGSAGYSNTLPDGLTTLSEVVVTNVDVQGGTSGGLIGNVFGNALVRASSAHGMVHASNTGFMATGGGLVGMVRGLGDQSQAELVIVDSHFDGRVSADLDVPEWTQTGASGGLVGRAHGPLTISNSYAAGSVGGQPQYTGALVGETIMPADVTGSLGVSTTDSQAGCLIGSGVGATGNVLYLPFPSACMPTNGVVDSDFVSLSNPNDSFGFSWDSTVWNFVPGQLPMLY